MRIDKIFLIGLTYVSIIAFVNHLHPVFICGALAISALFISLSAALLSGTWFFYLLTLVFLGGVIVLIIYMSTLCTNEKTSYVNLNIFSKGFIYIIAYALLGYFCFSFPLKSRVFPVRAFSSFNLIMLLFILVFLIIVIISCVKLVKLESGPLSRRL